MSCRVMRIGLATAIMAGLAWWLDGICALWLVVTYSALAYGASVLAFGILSDRDVQMIKDLWQRRNPAKS